MKTEDLGKATIDLLHATKAIVERDLGLGFITPERLRFTIEARKEVVKELAAKGMSQRQIAEVTGVGLGTVNRDLNNDRSKEEQKPSQNGTPDPLEQARKREVALREQLAIAQEMNEFHRQFANAEDCDKKAYRCRLRAGEVLLSLRKRIEDEGADWWEWYTAKSVRNRKDAERLMRIAQEATDGIPFNRS